MNNRETVEKVVAAFENNDTEALIAQVTDDFIWDMPGQQSINGKDALREMFKNGGDMKMISSTKNHFVIEGNTAVLDGEVECNDKAGKKMNMYYCDIYELEDGKLKKMVTYTIDKKSSS